MIVVFVSNIQSDISFLYNDLIKKHIAPTHMPRVDILYMCLFARIYDYIALSNETCILCEDKYI